MCLMSFLSVSWYFLQYVKTWHHCMKNVCVLWWFINDDMYNICVSVKSQMCPNKELFPGQATCWAGGRGCRGRTKVSHSGIRTSPSHFFNNRELFRYLFKLLEICVFSRSCWESFSQHLDKHWRVSPLRSSQSMQCIAMEKEILGIDALDQGVHSKISVGSLLWVEMFTAPVLLWTYCPTVGSRMLNIQMFTAPRAKGCLLIITRSITIIIWIFFLE